MDQTQPQIKNPCRQIGWNISIEKERKKSEAKRKTNQADYFAKKKLFPPQKIIIGGFGKRDQAAIATALLDDTYIPTYLT